jgi:ketosteroid isomerase-like protein
MYTSAELDSEVETALAGWVDAIRAHDREAIEWIHDDDFTCIELGGSLMDRRTHIEMELQTADIEMRFSDVRNHGFDDTVVTWARQSLRGTVPTGFFENELAVSTESQIEFVFTLVWRRHPEGLRVHTFHATQLEPAEAEVGETLLRTMLEWQRGFGPDKDREILERVHHRDFVWTGHDGSRMGRHEHIEAELKSDITNELVEFESTVLGDTAVSVGRLLLGGTFRSEGSTEDAIAQVNNVTATGERIEVAFTLTWKREGTVWQAWAVHLNFVPRGGGS